MNSGIFITHEQQLTQQLRLDTGLRYDRLHIAADDRFLKMGMIPMPSVLHTGAPSIALLVQRDSATHVRPYCDRL